MRTQLFRATALGGLAGAALMLAAAQSASAQTQVASDRPAGLIVFPKILSDPLDAFNRGQTIDTVVQLTNTDRNSPHAVQCFYIPAMGQCLGGTNPGGGEECRTNSDCSSNVCGPPVWGPERNFPIILTGDQPTGWVASVDRDITAPETAGHGRILAAPAGAAGYFEGDLKCIELDEDSLLPLNRNDLKGEATTYVVTHDPNDPNTILGVDVRRYNGIGFPALGTTDTVQNDDTLCLGGNGIGGNVCEFAEYAGCPERLIVNHLFYGASPEDIDADPSITLVPCTQRAGTQEPATATVQILVFNEFEQRFSLSTRVTCYRDIRLADLNVLYNVGVQGTVGGQSVLKSVRGGDLSTGGFGIIGIAEEGTLAGSTAYNVVYSGMLQDAADFVTYVPIGTED